MSDKKTKTVYDLVDQNAYSGDVVLDTYLSKEEAENDMSHFEERYDATCKIVERIEAYNKIECESYTQGYEDGFKKALEMYNIVQENAFAQKDKKGN